MYTYSNKMLAERFSSYNSVSSILTAVRETVRHASDCGGGTGIFLAVNSSTIVVIRGKRACIWGSIYLDMFGEEDKELK